MLIVLQHRRSTREILKDSAQKGEGMNVAASKDIGRRTRAAIHLPVTTSNDIPHDIIDTLTPPCDKGIREIDRIRFRGNISQAIRTD